MKEKSKKKPGRRIFSMFLVWIMIVACVDFSGFSVRAEEAQAVLKVNGIDMLTSSGEVIIGEGTAAYEADSHILTIDGIETDTAEGAAIQCENMNLTICVSGTNMLMLGDGNKSCSMEFGAGNVYIEGTGLIIAPNGIKSTGELLHITDVEVNAIVAGVEGLGLDRSGVTVYGSILLDGEARLLAQGGVRSNGDYSNAVSLGSANRQGIFEMKGNSKAELFGGDPNSTGCHGLGITSNGRQILRLSENAVMEIEGESTCGLIVGELTMSGDARLSSVIKIGADDYRYSIGMQIAKKLEMKDNAEIYCESPYLAVYDHYAANNEDYPGFAASLNGNSVMTLVGTNSVCLYANHSSMDINDSASLSAVTPGTGVYLENLTLNDTGKVNVVNNQTAVGEEAEGYALRVTDTLLVNGGVLEVSAENAGNTGRAGAVKNITINGGSINAGSLETDSGGKITINTADSFQVGKVVSENPVEFPVVIAEEAADYISVEKSVYTVGETVTIQVDNNYTVDRILVDGTPIDGNTFEMTEGIPVITVEGVALKPADYTAVDAAIAGVPEDLTKYTDSTALEVEKAIANVVRNLDITHQAEVDTMAEAINTAVKKLVLKQETTKLGTPKVKAASAAYNKVKLSWNKVSGAAGYEIYQYNASTKKYVKKATVTGTSYTVKGLKTGTTYKFKVRAYTKQSGQIIYSKYSSAVSAKPKLAKVTSLKKGKVKKTSATISWKKVSGASGYRIYRATSKNGKYKLVKTITKGKTVKFTNSKLKSKKTYYYKVRAYRKVGGKKVYGAYSRIIKVTTK